MEFIKDIPIERITKDKLTGCVNAYRKLFPEEYELVVSQIKNKRWLLEDGEFWTAKQDGIIERAMFEIPENLHTIIVQGLSENELSQFKGLKGSKWFMKNFPQFRTPEEF